MVAAVAYGGAAADPSDQVDVLVYGATPGGIAAARAAAKDGHSVLLVEPTARIGGLVTSGLSHTDFRTFEGLSGAYLEFAQRVKQHYVSIYGADSLQVEASFGGTFAEPKVNLAIFQQLLSEQPLVRVRKSYRLAGVEVKKGANGTTTIASVLFLDAEGQRHTFHAKAFIDGTYEGDLMAAAGVPWRVGREAQNEYGESLAPAQADGQLQAYNFRFIMTRELANRVMPDEPAGYRREDFAGVLPLLESGRIKRIFDYPKDCIFKAQTPALPGGKYDINDVSGGIVRLSLPGANLDWPAGDDAARQRVFQTHLRDQVGLLYFLQNDPAVPDRFREEARQWGWCRDEFAETGHLPPQLYVREARRMVGQHIYTERDTEHASGDARAKLHRDAIAVGDYGHNCHGTAHEGPRFGGKHVGEFYKGVSPYQIPYGVIVSRDVSNLLVPVAASSSHVGFCALRLEPIWMSLGQAAGHAAHLALRDEVAVQQVKPAALQQLLHADKSATIYVSEVPRDAPEFAAVQWWGTCGGLHGLAPQPEKPGQRGKNLHGQYYEAFPSHAAGLETPLDVGTQTRWLKLAASLGIAQSALEGATTRGEFIRMAFRQSQ